MNNKAITKKKPFGYTLVKSYPLSFLMTQNHHRRLKVFLHKGTICVTCGLEGTQVCLGIDKGGGTHLDVYTEDFKPLTVDHIIPKSKGGPMTLNNLQPMCQKCNTKKGNGELPISYAQTFPINDFEVFSSTNLPSLGDEVFKKTKNRKKMRMGGTVSAITENPHFKGQITIQLVEKGENSYYPLRNYYRRKV